MMGINELIVLLFVGGFAIFGLLFIDREIIVLVQIAALLPLSPLIFLSVKFP